MPELFGLQTPGLVALAVVVVIVAAVVAAPSGRRALAALAAQASRWPGMVRAELRGAAPLRVEGGADGAADPRFSRGDTTPDIPPVTRGLPVVDRPDRV